MSVFWPVIQNTMSCLALPCVVPTAAIIKRVKDFFFVNGTVAPYNSISTLLYFLFSKQSAQYMEGKPTNQKAQQTNQNWKAAELIAMAIFTQKRTRTQTLARTNNLSIVN